MPCYVGLDVSLKTTNICVLDEKGAVLKEGKTQTEPTDIAGFLRGDRRRYGRVIVEAGGLSRWLYDGLTRLGFPVIVVETRHAHGVLKASRNKTDRNDARGLAEMARMNVYRPVLVKTAETQQRQALMTARAVLVSKAVDLEGAIRGILRGFGVKLGVASRRSFEEGVTAKIGDQAWLTKVVRPLLRARNLLREQARYIELELIDFAKADGVCRRLMTAPGVGPMVAISFTVAIDEPARFAKSRAVGAHLGLTQRVKQSGEIARNGRISCWGDLAARRALYMAARAVLNPRTGPSWLRTWGLQIAARRGVKKAAVAVARRLAIVLHRMWLDGTEFRWAAAAE